MAVIIHRTAGPNVIQVTTNEVRAIRCSAAGPAGRPGPAGAAGKDGSGTLPPFDFSFGDASPATLLELPWDCEVMQVSLAIDESFDGAGAQLQLGVEGQLQLLMPSEFNDPTQLATYETTPRESLSTGTAILLVISPGDGATKGRGQVVLTVAPRSP